jgi:hypothetical protein
MVVKHSLLLGVLEIRETDAGRVDDHARPAHGPDGTPRGPAGLVEGVAIRLVLIRGHRS